MSIDNFRTFSKRHRPSVVRTRVYDLRKIQEASPHHQQVAALVMETPPRRYCSTYHDRQSYVNDSVALWPASDPRDFQIESLLLPPSRDAPTMMSHQKYRRDGSNVITSSRSTLVNHSIQSSMQTDGGPANRVHLTVWNDVDDSIKGDDQYGPSKPEIADELNADDACSMDEGAMSAEGGKGDIGPDRRRNARERNRVQTINSTFARLRQKLPMAAAYSATVRTMGSSGSGGVATSMFYRARKLSKVQILRAATQYIRTLQDELRKQRSQASDGDACSSRSSCNNSCVQYRRQAFAWHHHHGYEHRHPLRW